MATKFEQQQRLTGVGNIAAPAASGLASAAKGQFAVADTQMAVADVLQNFGKWGMEQYKKMRVESAQQEALAVEPSAEAPALRAGNTLTAEAYNKIVLAGHGAAIKVDYTKHLNELELQFKDDPQGFKAASDAYKAELVNQVAPEVRPFISTDYDMAAVGKHKGIAANFERKMVEQNLVGMGEAMDIIGDDAARAARSGDLQALMHNEAAFMQIVEAMESEGQIELATKMRMGFQDRMDEQLVLGQFDNSSDKLNFIEKFMENPPSDLPPEKADQLAGQMITMYNREKGLRDSATAASKKKFETGVKDYLAALEGGIEVTPEMHNKFDPEVVNALYTPEEAAAINAEIADFRTFNEDARALALATPDEVVDMLNRSRPDSGTNYRREQGQYEILQRAAAARVEALAKDPMAYITTYDETLREQSELLPGAIAAGDTAMIAEYSARARAVQERLGLSSKSVALLSNSQATALGRSLNDFSQGGQAAVDNINAIRDGFGSEWPSVQRQLAQDKAIGESAQIVAMIDDPNDQVIFAEALFRRKEYEEFIGDELKKDVTDNSADAVMDLTNTLRVGYGDSGVRMGNTMRRGIEAAAMKLLADGTETDAEAALETAFEMAVGDVEFYDSYRVPVDQDPAMVSGGVDEMVGRIKEGLVDIYAPPSALIPNEEDAKAVYIKALQLTPITSVDGSGIVFLDQLQNPLRGPDGKILEFSWSDLREIGTGRWETVY